MFYWVYSVLSTYLREDKLSIERILDTEDMINEDWLEINVFKMVKINRESIESLEEESKIRQKKYNQGVVEDLLRVG